jgi:Leucine-rich repeat (LRR) protein
MLHLRDLCFFYCLYNIGFHSSHVKNVCAISADTAKIIFPTKCQVYNATNNGTEVYCGGVSLTEALPAIWSLGTDFTSIKIVKCFPGYPVILSESFFVNTTVLTNLTITGCFVSDIAPGTFAGLVNLESLYLGENTLRRVTWGMFQGLSNLKKLYLNSQRGFQQIGTIEIGALAHMHNLEILDLSDNGRLQFFPPEANSTSFLTGLKKLRVLSMNGIFMHNLPKDENILFKFFEYQEESLTEVRLSGNHLCNHHLPMLRNLRNLRTLDLWNNILGYIQTNSLPKLANATLYLQNNNIMFVEVGALELMENVNITLVDDQDGNPFNCDCSNKEFAKWIYNYRGVSHTGVRVVGAVSFSCAGPQHKYEEKVMDYDPQWWECRPYDSFVIALVFILGFIFIIATIIMVISCNRVNIQHWQLERREQATPKPDSLADVTGPLLPRVRTNSHHGKTGAYLIFNYKDEKVNNWANRYMDANLHLHPMKVSLQWPAGPEVKPLWHQVKEVSFQVNAFLVIMTDEFLENHWPGIAEKCGIENIMKFVVVLFGIKRNKLPKELKRMGCPCLNWPVKGNKFITLERCRDKFWKELRVCLKTLHK